MMRVLVLHSPVADNAPPEEMDTLIAARAVSVALASRGYAAPLAAFEAREDALRAQLDAVRPDVVFNLVEGVDGEGRLAYIAPRMLEAIGVPYTGTGPDALIATQDKPLTKRMIMKAGLPTPPFAEPPKWDGLMAGRWIVKRADEDSSIGLDDASVVEAAEVPMRAAVCAERFGGRWFAESFVEGREFNVGLIGEKGAPRVLPMAEMTFEDWPEARPKIVGYAAKWHEASHEAANTVRRFGVEANEPELARALAETAKELWRLFDLAGFVRVDYRVDAAGVPQILEINPNPCIAPDGGFAVAAGEGGMSYAEVIERIVLEAVK
jgi:D-alanine-D-alanine ligase